MRRAVAACTSPEVFFGMAGSVNGVSGMAATADPLGLAMDALSL